MNSDISLLQRLGIWPSIRKAEFNMKIILPFFYKIQREEIDDDFMSDMEAPCAEFGLTPMIVLNAFVLDNNLFNIFDIQYSKYNLRDSFIRKEGRVYTDDELLKILERRLSQENMDFRITNSVFSEINVVCKDTGAISTITMEKANELNFYVISTVHYAICGLPESVVSEINMTRNLIKWSVDQSTCFSLLPNPEYTPSEAADYLIAHHNMIMEFQRKGIM